MNCGTSLIDCFAENSILLEFIFVGTKEGE